MPVAVTKQGQSVTIRMVYEGQALDKSASAAPSSSAFLSGSMQSAIPLLAFGSAIGRASGLAVGVAAGRTERRAVASVTALSAALGAGLAIRKGVASAAGLASISGAGGAVAAAAGLSAGEASAAGVGSVGTIAETVGASTGSAAVAGSGASVFAATGLSEGGSTAAAVYVPPPPAADSWDADVYTSNIAYSNEGRTAQSTTSGGYAARSLASFSSGKVYFEIYMHTISTIGFSDGNDRYAANTGSMVWSYFVGDIRYYEPDYTAKYTVNFTPKPTAGDTIQIAVDLDNNRAWFSKNGSGTWNASGTADPATNVGGLSIDTPTTPYHAVAYFNAVSQSATLNGTAENLVYTPPTGFSPLVTE